MISDQLLKEAQQKRAEVFSAMKDAGSQDFKTDRERYTAITYFDLGFVKAKEAKVTP